MPPVDLDLVFRALAAPPRRSLLDHLLNGPCRVNELADVAGLSQSATSQHLSVLAESGLTIRRRDGRWERDADALIDVEDWLRSHTFAWSAAHLEP